MNQSIAQGLASGTIIGSVFAWLQLRALRRNALLEQRKLMPTPLKQLPGSGARVAFLLLALVLVQVVLPIADKWWMTSGLVVSYGIPFLCRLKYKVSRAL